MKSARNHAVVLAVLAIAGIVSSAATASAQTSQTRPVSERLARLDAWMSAVQQHEPGELDEPVLQISGWSSQDLRVVWIDVMSVVYLVRQPRVSTFFVSEPSPGARPEAPLPSVPQSQRRGTQVFYSPSELRRLREVARQLTERGPRADSALLKRGAMLHADIAMIAPGDARAYSRAPGLQGFHVLMNDGRQTGFEARAGHWDMGRRLLDRVQPPGTLKDPLVADPASDPTVRLWYLASNAYLQSLMLVDPGHLARAVELFPRDADVLLLAGAMHETAGSPHIQAALRAVKVPAGVTLAVQDEGAELRQAEQFYRRALASNPELIEARIRLGHVLEKRGRHQEAYAQLRGLSSKTIEPELQYYAALFEGAAAESIGNEDAARQSYQRATSLYPQAQSPLLALSRLAGQSGDPAGARDAIQRVLKLPADDDERIDPWWTYDTSQGRHVDTLLFDLRSRF